MKVLKFLGAILALGACVEYIPYGDWICGVVSLMGIWKLVND